MASPAQLHLKQDGLYAGQTGSLKDFFVRRVVVPFNARDGVLPIENPGLCTVQEGGNDDGRLYLDLCGTAERVTLPYSL